MRASFSGGHVCSLLYRMPELRDATLYVEQVRSARFVFETFRLLEEPGPSSGSKRFTWPSNTLIASMIARADPIHGAQFPLNVIVDYRSEAPLSVLISENALNMRIGAL